MDSSNQSNDFVVGNCIGCNGLVRFPAQTRAHAMVRCPRCAQTYRLAEILDPDIPALEIVEEPAHLNTATAGSDEAAVSNKYEPMTEQENGRFIVPDYLAKAAERKPRRRSRSNSGVSNSGVSESDARNQDLDSARERAREQETRVGRGRPSRRSPKRNPFLDFIMYLLGGLMALPVAQLMIWWILGTDPIGIAPEVSRVIPMVVPPDLREGDPIESGADKKIKQKTPR